MEPERERSQLKQALIDARKDLERDEVIFAEKMRQMAGLQKKATKFYEDKKKLKEEIISLKAHLKRSNVSPSSSESRVCKYTQGFFVEQYYRGYWNPNVVRYGDHSKTSALC